MRGGADLHENRLFIEKCNFSSILTISGPSRPRKWIRLEISGRMVVSGGLEIKIEAISWPKTGYSQVCDITTGKNSQPVIRSGHWGRLRWSSQLALLWLWADYDSTK